MIKKIRPYLIFSGIGFLFLFIPLLKDFHFESAFVAAILGCFYAAYRGSNTTHKNEFQHLTKTVAHIYAIGFAPFLFSLFAGCLSFDGFALWLLLPLPSILFGFALARLIQSFQLKRSFLITCVILNLIALFELYLEFITLSQVYFFNHVWGWWPGPIYDEAIVVGESLLFYRTTTFLWALLFWFIPGWNTSKINTAITILALFALQFCYLNFSEQGIITPNESLQEQLSSHYSTEHFDLYFDEDSYSADEVAYLAARHEFHFQQIITALEIAWPEERKIESYLYAHAWQKKRLTGAKFTSYVPIWLQQDQLHIAKQQLEGVLKHELVHVLSKQFGNDLFNGSYSIGLIEGVAEAVAKDASPQSTLDQIIAANPPYPTNEQMKAALTISGFYSAASAVSYTTAGSFVAYLLKEYPTENFKEAYPATDFESAYNKPLDSLITEWRNTLPPIKIDSVDVQISEFIFSQRSLFQRNCPHSIPKELQLWDRYQLAVINEDTTTSQKLIEELYAENSTNALFKREWVVQQLKAQRYASIFYEYDGSSTDSLYTLQLLLGDTYTLADNYNEAQKIYTALEPKLAATKARNFKYSTMLRSDSLNATAFAKSRYHNELPSMEIIPSLNTPYRLLLAAKAIELAQHPYLVELATELLQDSLHTDWFDIYEQIIDQLIYLGEFELADEWLIELEALPLRARYQERLHELQEWRAFYSQYSVPLRYNSQSR